MWAKTLNLNRCKRTLFSRKFFNLCFRDFTIRPSQLSQLNFNIPLRSSWHFRPHSLVPYKTNCEMQDSFRCFSSSVNKYFFFVFFSALLNFNAVSGSCWSYLDVYFTQNLISERISWIGAICSDRIRQMLNKRTNLLTKFQTDGQTDRQYEPSYALSNFINLGD